MRLRSTFRPWQLVGIWTLLCLVLMIVGVAVLAFSQGGFNDVVSLSAGGVVALAFGLWLLGIVVLLLLLGVRRLRKRTRRAIGVASVVVVALSVGAASCGGSTGFRWRDDDAAWSPDGTRIAFVSNRANPNANVSQLYVVNSDGSSLRRLTNRGDVSYPRFSPDGRRIAYLNSFEDGRTELVVRDAVGAGRPIVPASALLDPTIPPAWSPDGRWVAFVQERNNIDPDAPMDLWLVSADGSRKRRVAAGIDQSTYSPLFSWAPNGRALAFGCHNGGICTLAAPAGVVRTLVRGDGADIGTTSVEWSPDGKQIAFLRDVPGGDIETLNQYGWVVRADGHGQHRLPRFDEGSVDQLVWVPAKPAMLAAAGDGRGHIYLLRSHGSGMHDLQLPGWDYEPVASRDGTKIAFDRVGSVPDNGAAQYAALYVATLPAGPVHQLTQRKTNH